MGSVVGRDYSLPVRTDLESVAREFMAGRCSRAALTDVVEATPGGGPDDALLEVFFGHGNIDGATDDGLRAALRAHFGDA